MLPDQRRLAIILSLSGALCAGSALVMDSGCAALAPVAQPAENLLGCVVSAAASDVVEAIADPASLIGAVLGQCTSQGALTLGALIQALEGAIAGTPADAGPAVASAKAGQSFDAVRLARLQKVLAAAKALQAADAGKGG